MSYWKKQIDTKTCLRVFLLALPMTIWAAPAQAQTAGDPYPTESIAVFARGSCPAGWSTYAPANGLFIVPTPSQGAKEGKSGEVVGTPLNNQQSPTHTHSFSNAVVVKGTEYAGASGCCAGGLSSCCNKSVSTSGRKQLENDGNTNLTTAPADVGVGYLQLLVCRKTAAPSADAAPAGVTVFFKATNCPTGWAASTLTEGRFLVGLPLGARPAAFGGEPLTPGEDREHTHEYSGSLNTDSAGIALTTGCCAKGYGKDGNYSYSGTTGRAKASLPYIQLLQCEKQ